MFFYLYLRVNFKYFGAGVIFVENLKQKKQIANLNSSAWVIQLFQWNEVEKRIKISRKWIRQKVNIDFQV